MICLKKLETKYKGKNISFDFGIPDNEKELEGMFKLRCKIYKEKNYIDKQGYSGGLEKDKCDQERRCVYFIGSYNNEIFATIRLIKDDVLPTEKSFSFQEPNEMMTIKKGGRAELGRFVITPPMDTNGVKIFLPRGIIMLILLNILSEYGMKNKISGGYSFIKKKLERKLTQRKYPFHSIKNYKLTVGKDDVLYKYFSNIEDPVVPIYFLTDEFFKYTNKILSNRLLFKTEKNVIILKNNFYTKILSLLRII